MNFELYRRGHHVNPRNCLPAVRITGKVRLVLTKPCAEWIAAIGGVEAELLFDREDRRVGIRPVKIPTTNSYKLTIKTSQVWLSARQFIKFIGDPPNGMYPAEFDRETGILSFLLSNHEQAPVSGQGPVRQKTLTEPTL